MTSIPSRAEFAATNETPDNAKPKVQPGSRCHHYIPTFYLRQWETAKDGRLCQFSRPHREVVRKRKHAEAMGYMDDLNSINDAPPELRSFIEDQFLLRVDQLARDALQCLLNGGLALSDDLRSGWTHFRAPISG